MASAVERTFQTDGLWTWRQISRRLYEWEAMNFDHFLLLGGDDASLTPQKTPKPCVCYTPALQNTNCGLRERKHALAKPVVGFLKYEKKSTRTKKSTWIKHKKLNSSDPKAFLLPPVETHFRRVLWIYKWLLFFQRKNANVSPCDSPETSGSLYPSCIYIFLSSAGRSCLYNYPTPKSLITI